MKIMISDIEKERRKLAWLKATSSSFFEGIRPTSMMNSIANKFIKGEYDISLAVTLMIQDLENSDKDWIRFNTKI